MSTKSKKRYLKLDIDEARKSNIKVSSSYSRRTERRKTVQVRIGKDWHTRLKLMARDENLVLSFVMDKICELFFKNYSDYKKIKNKERKQKIMSFGSSLLD